MRVSSAPIALLCAAVVSVPASSGNWLALKVGSAVASSQASCRSLTRPVPCKTPCKRFNDVRIPELAGDREHAGNDLQRQSRRGFERSQIRRQRAPRHRRAIQSLAQRECRARASEGIVSARLFQQQLRAFGIALEQRLLRQLAQIMCSDALALRLHVRRQLVKNLQGVGLIHLLLVDAQQVFERGVPEFAGCCQLFEEPPLRGP